MYTFSLAVSYNRSFQPKEQIATVLELLSVHCTFLGGTYLMLTNMQAKGKGALG